MEKKSFYSILISGIMVFGSVTATFPISQLPPIYTSSSLDSLKNEVVTDLYIWRHGETDSNILELMSGGGDTQATLTDKGQKQAVDLGNKIAAKGLQLLAVYSSDLPRAVQTAAAVLTTTSSEKIQAIIPAPQLREILHGQYELVPAEIRTEKVATLFKNEFEHIQDSSGGHLDPYHFWKIHPMSGRIAAEDAPVIDVQNFLESHTQEPETPYEMYRRIYVELVRIAEESQILGNTSVGISTHGAVLASLINVAIFGDQNIFVPPPTSQGKSFGLTMRS